MSATVLLIEDDPDIRRLVAELLAREGFAVEQAGDAPAADAVLQRLRPDIVVLDLMLPGEDGLSICRRLRQGDAIPILMLSAKADDIDRVVGLEMGADDYLVKPFNPRELLARVRAILRRVQPGGGLHGGSFPVRSRRFAFDRFTVDLDARQLACGEAELQLTGGEFDLLSCMVLQPRRVLTRDRILSWTRGRESEAFDRSVDMLVSRLRRKLERASPGCKPIATVRNGGYIFTPVVQPVG